MIPTLVFNAINHTFLAVLKVAVKRESHTLNRSDQVDSRTARHLPVVDLLVDPRADLMNSRSPRVYRFCRRCPKRRVGHACEPAAGKCRRPPFTRDGQRRSLNRPRSLDTVEHATIKPRETLARTSVPTVPRVREARLIYFLSHGDGAHLAPSGSRLKCVLVRKG